ncbi:MAG: hypothetical protein ABIS86_01515 [Streptosporangiaceae bacterium]
MTILDPQLTLTKSADRQTVTPGGTITYTITAANTGPTAYTGAAFSDSLASVLTDATYNNDASANSGSVSYVGSTLQWTGNLAVGATATITYTVTVKNPDPGDKLPVNTLVSDTLGNNCPAGGSDTRCRVVVSVLLPGLTITKSAASPSTVAGGTATYTMTIVNTGQTPFTGATVQDDLTGLLDDASYTGGATASTGTVTYSAPNLTWTGNLAVGATATVTYAVAVADPDTGDGLLTSTASTSAVGSNCAPGSADTRCSATVTLSGLVIVEAYEQATATPGSVVRLNATFTNTGKTPYTNISIYSSGDDALDDVVPNGDQTASSGTFVLGATGITWTGDIPVGGVVNLTGTVTVLNPDPGNKIVSGTAVSSAPGNNCQAGSVDGRCTSTLLILLPALKITKSSNTPAQVPGGVVGYTVMIENTGQTPYTGASIRDDLTGLLDDAVYNADAAATSGSVNYSTPNLTWTGDLAVGATTTLTYSATINDPTTGDKLMVDTVTSTEVGSNCQPSSGDVGCAANVAVLTRALTIVKTMDKQTAVAGDTVTYTLTVTNSGQVPYTGASLSDDLTGLLDDATYSGGVTASAGTADYSGPNITWTGNLSPTQQVTVTYAVTVDNPDTGDKLLSSLVTSPTTGSNCAVGSTDTRCAAAVPITDVTALTFVKTSSPIASTVRGGVVSYTVTVTNTAASPYLGATFTDSLQGVLDDADYNGDATASVGTVDDTAPGLSWTGTVPADDSATITYSVTAHAAKTGDDLLDNTLVSTSPNANCQLGLVDQRCTKRVTLSELIIQGSSDVTETTPGSVIRLTATFTNTGQTPYYGIKVFTEGGGVIDDATANGDYTYSSGTMVWGTTGGVWTGDIPVGDTVTITSSLTVNDPITGDKDITSSSSSEAEGSNCPVNSTDPRCSLHLPVFVPQLTLTKTTDATQGMAVPGTPVGYTITINNNGETPYTGITVTDAMAGAVDDAAYGGNAAASTGAVSVTGSDLSWTGDVPVNGTVTITYTLTVRDPDPGDKLMVNMINAEAVGSTCSSRGQAAACRTVVTVLTPRLTINRTTNVAETTQGGVVTYTIGVTNTGQTPYAAASLTDDLADVLDDAVDGGNLSATTGTAQLAGTTLTWTGALAPTAAATITFSVTVRDPDPANRVLIDTVVSADSGNNCPSGGSDPGCTGTVPVAVLRIVATTDVNTAIPTQVVTYTSVITNTGQTTYVGADATFSFPGTLDNATYNGDGATTAGNLTFRSDGTVTWTGDLPPGQSAIVTASFTVNNPATGDQTMTAFGTSATPGSNCPVGGTDPNCSVSVTVLIPQLTITKTADRTTVTPGGTIGYTITVANTGPTAYTGATVTDSLERVLTDADYNGDAEANTGVLSYTSPNLTWTGDLALGVTATITFTATVKNPDPGDKQVNNTVSSAAVGSTCPPDGSGTTCAALVTVVVPALTITKTVSPTSIVAGGTVVYTVVVANTGQTSYLAATFTDTLAGVLDDASYDNNATATSGSVAYDAPALTWTGDLALGATATVTYSVTTVSPGSGDANLVNAVSSTSANSNCAVDLPGSECTVETTVVAQKITLGDLTDSFTLSGPPGTTARADAAVSMTVVSNSPGGYNVTVRSEADALTAAGSTLSIPISGLRVRETGTLNYQILSSVLAVPIHQESGPSAATGDLVRSDYELLIPFVPSGTYSGSLNYIATTQ